MNDAPAPHQELWRYLLNALEALGQHPDLLHPRAAAEGDGEGAGDGVARHLLPALAGLLAQSPSGDTRFLCMRLLCDLMLACLPAEGGPVDHGRPGAAAARARAWAVLEEGWLPQLPRLLGDEEPIPLYALKLCSGALEADRRRVCRAAAGKEGCEAAEEEADAEVHDRLLSAGRRWHHGCGVLRELCPDARRRLPRPEP